MTIFEHQGFCPICDQKVMFRAEHTWFRDHLLCMGCGSIPRERALMQVIRDFCPNFRELDIHESSPGGRGVSFLLRNVCPSYSTSHYFPEITPGQKDPRTSSRCENLESLTFKDSTFDLLLTQDVMEHVFNPEVAFREIARVLRPHGAHIFTVPMVNKTRPSRRRASLNANGEIIHHLEAQYHGNPIDSKGSLVTIDWGFDLAPYVQSLTGMPTIIFQIDNIDLGIRAELIEVVVSLKSNDNLINELQPH